MREGALLARPRRLRRSPALRGLVRESHLRPDQFIQPLFVEEGLEGRRPIPSMPGVERLGVAEAVSQARRARELRLGGVMLFGIPSAKDPAGAAAKDPKGVVAATVRALKREVPGLLVIVDVCLCEYTDHGHCGVVVDGDVSNDRTLPLLAQMATTLADAGADVVAPSAMMDGQVAALRHALDAGGHAHVPILSYAAKYASAFYGPFRDAAGSAPRFGDRSSYQMDPANARDALREIRLDLDEGADLVLVKPGLPCLDILARARDAVDLPLGAYQVSGEYAMIELACREGWLDRRRAILESLQALRRAGADFIVTYHAAEAAALLKEP